MNTGTVESSRYASYADAYFSDLMADSSFWPVKVRDIAEPLSDCRAEDEPDDWGHRAMADAALYDLCLSTATTGGQHETFPHSPGDEAGRPSPVPFTEVPQRTLELWNACGKHDWLNSLLKARSADLLRVRGHGDTAERSLDAIDASLQS